MIGFLRGTVVQRAVDHCLLDVHDVGYRVFVSRKTCDHVTQGEEALLYIHTHVREDAILLYGFFSQEEYELFQHLIGISGIGPKGAQSILSEVTPHDFYRLIHQKDVKGITKLPGIGKKTAERLVLELKDKFSDYTDTDANDMSTDVSDVSDSMIAEATEALMSLGFQQNEIQNAFRGKTDYQSTEELVRYALSALQRF
jgi:holliday junction DNA helicase ruvA